MERQAQERNEHELQCQKLIGCFKTTASTLKDTVTSIERFADSFDNKLSGCRCNILKREVVSIILM